jgi:hypothetical protein
MKTAKTKNLVIQHILLLIPLIIYGIYKNGYLIYEKKLIQPAMILKPLYFVLIGIFIKLVYDLIRYHKIKVDYDYVCLSLLGMIVPYNTNLIIYSIVVIITFIIIKLLSKYIKFNYICLVYIIILGIAYIMHSLTFMTPLDLNYSYNFDFLDILMGRSIGGISSTSLILITFAYIFLVNNYYYKKNIPLFINISYLLLAIVYYAITKNISILLNIEVVFGSVFVSSIPNYSPYRKNNQIFYGIAIGVLSFIIAIFINRIIAIYVATFIASLFLYIEKSNRSSKKSTKLPISK